MGCIESAPPSTPSATLTIASTIPIGDIVPFTSRMGLGANLIELLHRPLIHLSSDGVIVPDVAKEAKWENDGKLFRVKLDKEMAADVQYTFAYLSKLPVPEFKEGLKNLEKLEVGGDGEVLFHLRRFDRIFPFILSQVPILSSDEKKSSGDFIITSKKEDEVVLERKNPSPYLVNRIVVLQVSSSRRIVRETVAGNIDISLLADDKAGLTLKDLPGVGFGELKSTFLYFALLNRDRKDLAWTSWDQVSDRLNRNEMIRQLGAGGLDPAVIPVPVEDTWSSVHDLKQEGDEGKLRRPKRPLSLYYLELQPIIGRIALLLKRKFAETGIKLDLNQLTPEDFQKKILVEKDFDIVLLPYAIKHALSSNYFVFHSAESEGSVNLANYKNADVDQHLEEARYEQDDTKAKAAFTKAIEAMREDPPGIFLFWLKTPILYRKSCMGFKFNTNEFFSSLKDVRCEPSAAN